MPSLSNQVEVKVLVTSDTAPIFANNIYTASIREDAPLHSTVFVLQADSMLGHKVVYTLYGGDPINQFYVAFDAGMFLIINFDDFFYYCYI